MRILVVCTANVCRSPMGAALLQKHLAAASIGARVRSAGTHAGMLATDPGAIATMRRHGLDIGDHHPRLLDHAMLANDGADLVITMTREQLRAVTVMDAGVFRRTFTARELARRVFPLRTGQQLGDASVHSWLRMVGHDRNPRDLIGEDANDDVADAYGLTAAAHDATAATLDACMADIARSIGAWSD
jgi:protein-tyrosine phosphatase